MKVDPRAGKSATPSVPVNVARLMVAYDTRRSDGNVAAQRVSFGTSGHRVASLDSAFNKSHFLAVTQALCADRREQGIDSQPCSTPTPVESHAILVQCVKSFLGWKHPPPFESDYAPGRLADQ
ncbi:MAG: hypothetical protein K8J08_20265 [Thermoanaerobaculia bacterium]|nr:hypothetical protein [Thermoanaerobaculia bacterium]